MPRGVSLRGLERRAERDRDRARSWSSERCGEGPRGVLMDILKTGRSGRTKTLSSMVRIQGVEIRRKRGNVKWKAQRAES